MADVNIKNLPETPEVNFGDFIILETIQGTQVIKYDNFVITEQNTTFEPLLSSHSDEIALNTARFGSLSSNFFTLSSYFENQARVTSAGGNYIYSLSALGLGTSDVAEKLTVLGNISASGSLSAIGSDYNYFGGRVGIGTSTPARDLHVLNTDGRIRVEATAGNHPGFEIAEDNERKWIIFNRPGTDAQGTEDQMVFKTNTSERMVIQKTGKIGIGTTTPHTMLHVGGSGSFAMAESQEHPVDPGANEEAYFYIKADKFIIKFNDSGTIRYKYMVLSGDHVTWVQTLTAP